MAGETSLAKLLASMEPVLNPGEYVFASVPNTRDFPAETVLCAVREQEGLTVVVSIQDADRLGLAYEFVASWITLNVHSALEAVGLTAAFATALARHGISCNVMAGYYHDHLFVGKNDAEKALEVLRNLSKEHGTT